MWKKILIGAILAGCLSAPALFSQVPLGDDFQINSFSTGYQVGPSVAVRDDRSFVVVWQDSYGQDGDGPGIFGRRYSSAGNPVGDEFQVNTYTTGAQFDPALAMDPTGDFVVVWSSPSGGSLEIIGQRFGSAGDPQGGEFNVNSFTTNTQVDPVVAAGTAGDFVVAWQSADLDGDIFGIAGRRFASDGMPIGDDFQVNSYTTGSQGSPALAFDDDLGFLVAWVDQGSGGDGQDGDQEGVFAQIYAPDGTPRGGEFQVNSYTTDRQYGPSVAAGAPGEFIVAWHGDNSGGILTDIMGRRYSDQGAPLGAEFRINAFTTSVQHAPAVAKAESGEIIAAWESNFVGSLSRGISGRVLAADGTPKGGEFQVATYHTGIQNEASVAVAGGLFVVTWETDESSGPDTSFSVQGQRYELLLFADGFESGDAAAWTSQQPAVDPLAY